jgi:hypothetical protein
MGIIYIVPSIQKLAEVSIMNIFQYQGQEEDHYTNILMNILALNDCKLVKPFLKSLIPSEAHSFNYEGAYVSIRKKHRPQVEKENEFIIGIAPYKNAIHEKNTLEENLDSIPDAWICGANFNILFEFKIRGSLDEAQISAHKKLLSPHAKVIRLQWSDVTHALQNILANEPIGDVENFLITNFLEVSRNFKQKRRSSGMPSQIISHTKKENEVYFIITGSKSLGTYTVDKVVNNKVERINSSLDGIQSARRWIAKYVNENKDRLPLDYQGEQTIINDYCVVPGRPEKKNQWNQWRLGTMLDND